MPVRSSSASALELGGKSPLIVFDDADIENAIGGAMLGNFYSTGQICSNGTRTSCQSVFTIASSTVWSSRATEIRIGDPLDPGTTDRADSP